MALPPAAMTSQRVTNLYDLMDAAYDAPIIREDTKRLGHVPIIDINPRRNTRLKEEMRAETRRFELLHFERPEDRRYKERTSVERVYGRLNDEFGGRMIRVRGHAKIVTHPNLAIESLLRTGSGIGHQKQQVIPAQAGIQKGLDSCFRRNDRRKGPSLILFTNWVSLIIAESLVSGTHLMVDILALAADQLIRLVA